MWGNKMNKNNTEEFNNMDRKLYYLKALTSIHAGSGEELDIVDMPIQREKHSNIPKIEGSSLKGSIKHWIYRSKNIINSPSKEDEFFEMLGKDENADRISRISITDARLLFFPIKSSEDIFKLITCPYVLNRWIEDMNYANESKISIKRIDQVLEDGKCISKNSTNKIFLEEYIFEPIESEILDNWDLDSSVLNRIVVINDTEFVELVNMYTEVITRNKIDFKTGAAKGTGLFTEEYLPTETIMYFMAVGTPNFNNKDSKSKYAIDYLDNNLSEVFQVGGNATIGKGFMRRIELFNGGK